MELCYLYSATVALLQVDGALSLSTSLLVPISPSLKYFYALLLIGEDTCFANRLPYAPSGRISSGIEQLSRTAALFVNK